MNTLRDALHRNRVLDLGPLPAPRLPLTATLHQALPFLVRGRRGAIVIVDGAAPIGIFTERDVVNRLTPELFRDRGQRSRVPVAEVMSRPPITIRRQATLAEAVSRMVENELRHLVVVDAEGSLRGLLITNDLVQFLTDQFPEQTLNLPPRLHQSYPSRGGA